VEGGNIISMSTPPQQKRHRNRYQHMHPHQQHPQHALFSMVSMPPSFLLQHFPSTKFNVIEFNFPHIRGKNDHRRNRQLMQKFIDSASQVIDDAEESNRIPSQLRIVVPQQQSSILSSQSIQEWKMHSWYIPVAANECGFVFVDIEVNPPLEYRRSSYRGQDSEFLMHQKETQVERLVFQHVYSSPSSSSSAPTSKTIPIRCQLCCYHQLAIRLEQQYHCQDSEMKQRYHFPDLRVQLPPGMLVEEYKPSDILEADRLKNTNCSIQVFHLVMRNASHPITRAMCDAMRIQLQSSIEQQWGLEIAKKTQRIGPVYPYRLF